MSGKERDPYKFDPETAEDVLRTIRAGNFLETAAAFAGVTPKTVRNWLRKGARQKEGPLADFARDYAEAEATAETYALAQITRSRDWAAAAWRLERRFGKRWSRKAALELSGPDGGPIESTVHTLSDLVRAAAGRQKVSVGTKEARAPGEEDGAGGGDAG